MVCVLNPVRAVQGQVLATQANTWHVVTFDTAAYSHSPVSIKDYDGVPENCCGNLTQRCKPYPIVAICVRLTHATKSLGVFIRRLTLGKLTGCGDGFLQLV